MSHLDEYHCRADPVNIRILNEKYFAGRLSLRKSKTAIISERSVKTHLSIEKAIPKLPYYNNYLSPI